MEGRNLFDSVSYSLKGEMSKEGKCLKRESTCEPYPDLFVIWLTYLEGGKGRVQLLDSGVEEDVV